ncbi:MAG: hypothetical protein ISS38_04345 [Candidatus Cloacimonetes bacterium]|nr:hypothetical protein [Candidatus Cloacimonadota bacterium]
MKNRTMKKIIIFIFVSLVLFFACEFDQEEPGDTTPPSKVYLIPHLGDAGDTLYISTAGDTFSTSNYSNYPTYIPDSISIEYTIPLTDDNNGIDAEPGNNMKIQWDEMDGDIFCIKVYRFSNEDTTECIDTLDNVNSTEYVDTFSGIDQRIDKEWSYFIIPYDNAGNSTVSDTATYQLIGKPELLEPANDSTFSITDTVNFSWQPYGGYSFRILFFDEDGSLVFADDTYSDDEYSLSVLEFNPQLDTPYKWRIDAFGFVNSGSESEERRITFIQNKVD